MNENLVAYPFTDEGGFLIQSLKLDKYKKYKGSITKAQLDKIYRTPDALLFIKEEDDETFTHSYLSSFIDKRVISRGCKAQPTCPCLGCRIVDMVYIDEKGNISPAIDSNDPRSTPEWELALPLYSDGEEIISKMLNREPGIKHEFSHKRFDSPLEQMFYELAFLDLHLYPQHAVGKYRLDFAIPDKKIAIELDGHEYLEKRRKRKREWSVETICEERHRLEKGNG